MYLEFRPEVDGWGKRGEVKCSVILELRKKVDEGDAGKGGGDGESVGTDKIVKVDVADGEDKMENGSSQTATEEQEPERKKARGMTLEEYEAALDADETFNDLDLGIGDLPGDPVPTVSKEGQ